MGTNSVTARGRLGFSLAIIFNIYANNATKNGTSKFIINNVRPVHSINMIMQLWQYQSVNYRKKHADYNTKQTNVNF
jgi:hypothetical protein